MEGCVTPRPLPTQIFTVIFVFPSAEVDNCQVPGPAPPQAGPRAASSGPGAACTDCARSHPGRALSYPAGQPGVGAAPGEQPGPCARQGSGDRDGPRPWQGGRGHCRPGGQLWASPHGHQWDRAAHSGSRPEPQRTRDTRCDTTDSAVVTEA